MQPAPHRDGGQPGQVPGVEAAPQEDHAGQRREEHLAAADHEKHGCRDAEQPNRQERRGCQVKHCWQGDEQQRAAVAETAAAASRPRMPWRRGGATARVAAWRGSLQQWLLQRGAASCRTALAAQARAQAACSRGPGGTQAHCEEHQQCGCLAGRGRGRREAWLETWAHRIAHPPAPSLLLDCGFHICMPALAHPGLFESMHLAASAGGLW